jgi:hypothetical protein
MTGRAGRFAVEDRHAAGSGLLVEGVFRRGRGGDRQLVKMQGRELVRNEIRFLRQISEARRRGDGELRLILQTRDQQRSPLPSSVCWPRTHSKYVTLPSRYTYGDALLQGRRQPKGSWQRICRPDETLCRPD